MSFIDKTHYVGSRDFYALCDDNKHMTPGRFKFTNIRNDVTCEHCLKTIADSGTPCYIADCTDLYHAGPCNIRQP